MTVCKQNLLETEYPRDALFRSSKLSMIGLSLIFCFLLISEQQALATAPWPKFQARTLTGEKVDSDKLVGQLTLLIVTPSRDAARETRKWVEALRKEFGQTSFLVRDVLAINLPFFMSMEDAIQHARQSIPRQFHDQTWLLDSTVLERELGIPPQSSDASIVVLDRQGEIVVQEHGDLTNERLSDVVKGLRRLQ